MREDSKSTGRCFCGDVEFTLNGEAEVMAYCHCDSCRQWSAGPVSAFTLWKPENIKISKGADKLGGFTKNPLTGEDAIVSNRVWCKTCGGHVYTDHPAMGLVDIPAVILKSFTFKPGFHVHYQESVHPVKDGSAYPNSGIFPKRPEDLVKNFPSNIVDGIIIRTFYFDSAC